MANVYVNTLGVPRKARNGRIYGGVSFNSTNANQSGNSAAAKHFENGKLTGLTSNTVVVYFTEPFTIKPTLVQLKVYRMVENIPIAGKFVMQDVLHYFDDDEDWVVLTGFSLFIDSSEDLNGVIIDYCFTE